MYHIFLFLSCALYFHDISCISLLYLTPSHVFQDTVAFLLSHRSISCNGIHPPGSGTTALHLAASLGRADVVNLLLEQDGIDDTVRDANGKNCKEVARGKDTVRAINGIHLSSLHLSHPNLLM